VPEGEDKIAPEATSCSCIAAAVQPQPGNKDLPCPKICATAGYRICFWLPRDWGLLQCVAPVSLLLGTSQAFLPRLDQPDTLLGMIYIWLPGSQTKTRRHPVILTVWDGVSDTTTRPEGGAALGGSVSRIT